MRSLPTAGLVIACASAALPADAEPTRPEPRAALAPLANSVVDGEYAGAIVIALIPAAGPPQILGYGETVRGNHRAPDAQTVFEIGSVSKVFTSLLLAEQVVDKALTLETPIATLLPKGTKLPEAARPITVLDLATHTSGLPRMPDNLHPADPANPYADYTTAQLYAFLATAKLAHDPGGAYEYSNLGAALLGHGLALRGKASWDALVIDQIARPLGMSHTTVALSDEARARMAQGYSSDGDEVKPWDLPTFAGAGALRSTAADMVVFVKAELAAPGAAASRITKAMALSQQPQRDLGAAGPPGKIGLAWHLKPDGTIWHNGETGGFHSFVAFDPKKGVGVVVLGSGATSAVDGLGVAALASLTGDPVPATLGLAPADKPVDEVTLEGYLGAYGLAPGFTITVTRDRGKLYAQATGQPRFRLHPTAPREFALHVVAASVTFEVDAKGKATALVLHQGGSDHRAPRM